MFRHLIIFTILLTLKPPLGSPNDKITVSYIFGDVGVTKILHEIELLSNANANLRRDFEANNERMDRRQNEILNEIRRLNGFANESNSLGGISKEIDSRLSGFANKTNNLDGISNDINNSRETNSRLNGLFDEIKSLGGISKASDSRLKRQAKTRAGGLANKNDNLGGISNDIDNSRADGLANETNSLSVLLNETNSRLDGLANETNNLGEISNDINNSLKMHIQETNSRLDGLDNEIKSLSGISKEIDSRLSGIANKTNNLGVISNDINNRLKRHTQETNSRLNGLSNEIKSLSGTSNEINMRLNGLENEIKSRLNRLSKKIQSLSEISNEINSRLSGLANLETNTNLPAETSTNTDNEQIEEAENLPNCLRRAGGLQEITIDRFSPVPFLVYCDNVTHGGGWTVIQRRMDGSVDFYRNWADYREGFGDLAGEFFIGLEKLHAITMASTNELLIVVIDNRGIELFAKYEYFVIGDESEYYALNILGDYFGDAGDNLSFLKSSRFYTKDNDDPEHCMRKSRTAWWHTEGGCWPCLNGRYGVNTFGTGIIWFGLHSEWMSLSYVQMMIRPRSYYSLPQLSKKVED